MSLMKNELKEWKSLKAKSKKHKIKIKRVGPANVTFGNGVYAQLGTGTATTIMDARVRLKERRLLETKRTKIIEKIIKSKSRKQQAPLQRQLTALNTKIRALYR